MSKFAPRKQHYYKISMKIFLRIAFAAIAALLMTACGGSDTTYQYKTQYLPVQLVGSEKWSILDVNSGEVVAKDAFENVPSPIVNGMFYVMNDEGTYDYYDVAAPTKAVAGHFGSATSFSDDGVAVCSRIGEPLTVINRKGEIVKQLPKDVAQCSMFARGMAAVQNDRGTWGYINAAGDTIIPANYSNANLFLYNDYAVVVSESQVSDTAVNYTVIDKTGKVVTQIDANMYQIMQPYFVNGVLPVVKGDSLVCLNPEGKEVPNPNDDQEKVANGKYDNYQRTPSGDYIVIRGKKAGLVDCNNKVLIPIEHDNLVDINGERLIAVDNDVYSIVNRNGKPVGNVKFENAHVGEDNPYAARGFIDTNLAASTIMMLFDDTSCAGANAETTLMDMNSMVSTDARQYAGNNTLVMPQGPYVIQYVFDREVATMTPDSTSALFNFDAKVKCVIISMNLRHCPPSTEETITKIIESNLGTNGFVLARDGIFCSDHLTAVNMGYDKGVVNLLYHMHFNESVPQPKNKRSK